MSTHKNFDRICVVVTVLALLLTILFMNGERLGIQKVVDEDAELNSDSAYFTTNDLNSSWDTTEATVITLNGTSAKVSGSGAYANGSNVVITQSGTFVVSGTLTDGNLTVDAKDYSKVWILLNGVDITCSDDAALRVDQADKVFLTLAEGTENSLQSGETMSDTALADGTDGAIFAHDDLTINGSGSMTVTAGYKHGIAANDDLVITGGTLTVTAPKDAIHANDSLRITNATLTVDAGDDGIVVSNEGGYLYVESGTVNVTADDDAIHTTGDVTIDGGSLTIDAGDDGIHSDTSITINNGTLLITECYEGIEAPQITVNGGDITIYPTDDGFNANGGSPNMGGPGGGMSGGFGGRPGSSGGDSDSTESGAPDFSGEMPSMSGAPGGSSDSNTDSQSSESGRPEMPGESGEVADQMPEMSGWPGGEAPDMSQMPGGSGEAATTADGSAATDEELPTIRITGGNITIINETAQDADGLDSNGSIYIEGGSILISLSGNGSNNAIDYGSENNGVAEISGGTIIACGGSAMAESFDESSTQGSIFYTMSTVAAGTNLTVKDSSGNVLLTWDVPCSYSAVTVSCPEMVVGETYQVIVGDTVEEVTLDTTVATIGSSSGGMGGFGGNMGGGFGGGFQMGSSTEGDSTSTSETSGQGFGGGKMGGGHGGMGGGKGQRPGQSSDTTDTTGDSTTTDGAMPSFPGGDFTPNESFDPSQMGEPPEMPDASGMPTPPDMSGETSTTGETNGSEMPSPPDMSGETSDTEESAGEVTVDTGAQEVPAGTWAYVGVCALVLLAGLLVAILWKKHG